MALQLTVCASDSKTVSSCLLMSLNILAAEPSLFDFFNVQERHTQLEKNLANIQFIFLEKPIDIEETLSIIGKYDYNRTMGLVFCFKKDHNAQDKVEKHCRLYHLIDVNYTSYIA